MRTNARWVAVLAAVSLGLAACSSGGGGSGDGDAASCPVGALDDASGPVEITFWHAVTNENEVVFEDLIAQFEAQEPRIDVNLINQVTYMDLFNKFIAGLDDGNLPDIAQMEETTVQKLVDSQSTVPVQACVDADDYDLSDFLPRALDYYTVDDTLRSMPWNVSNPVLIYNKNLFAAAGLDPEVPPATLDEVREFSRQIVDSGAAPYGMALHVEPYINEFLFAKSGVEYVNNGNGRDARATESQLDSPEGLEIWTWWDEMVDSGLALNTGSQPANYDHLFALANGNAAMTFEASGALGPAEAVLASGEFGDLELGVGSLPALEPGGGVPVGDGSLWITRDTSPEKQAAAWALIKFLSDPEQQAFLSIGSQGGYVPIRQSVVENPDLLALWAQKPWLRVPFDQLESGPTTTATVGSIIGDYQGVRDAVREGYERMLVGGVSPEDALAQAQAQATEVIQAYNERVGA